MNRTLLIPLSIIAGLVIFFVVSFTGMSRPGSIFCFYKIYKQPDGTYQVWHCGRLSWKALDNATYEQAKAFQVEKCKTFWERPHPAGESVE